MNKIKINNQINLLGEPDYRDFLEIQAIYGNAQRGGINIISYEHAKRISSNVNLLNNSETKNLIFNETIFSN